MHINEPEREETDIKDCAVRNSKDSLFRYIFSASEALWYMYTWISGKDINHENIEPISLDEKLQRRTRYNDIAFITKDNRLVVFIEHQSTLNSSIVYRMLEYYIDVMRIFNYHKKPNRPKVEMYVAYNGKKILQDNDKILSIDLGAINVTANVVDVRFEALPTEKANNINDSLAGYAYFVKFFEEGKAQGNTAYESYYYAVEKCAAAGYLSDIVKNKELIDMFAEHYSYDDQIFDEGIEKGIEKGIERGIEKGIIESAIKMLRSGMLINEVTKILQLSDNHVKILESR